jgi:DNA-binding response OmpR family regulator
MMPGISGYEIISWLSTHEWSAHVPVVIMSADPCVPGANLMRGVTDWVSKPFQIDVLLAKLERYLSLPQRVLGAR